MSEMENHFQRNQKKNSKKKQKINVKMPHVNKKTASEKWKFGSNNKLGLEWTMNGLRKPFRKNVGKKSKKQ